MPPQPRRTPHKPPHVTQTDKHAGRPFKRRRRANNSAFSLQASKRTFEGAGGLPGHIPNTSDSRTFTVQACRAVHGTGTGGGRTSKGDKAGNFLKKSIFLDTPPAGSDLYSRAVFHHEKGTIASQIRQTFRAKRRRPASKRSAKTGQHKQKGLCCKQIITYSRAER